MVASGCNVLKALSAASFVLALKRSLESASILLCGTENSLRSFPSIDSQSANHNNTLDARILCRLRHILTAFLLQIYELLLGTGENADQGNDRVRALYGRQYG